MTKLKSPEEIAREIAHKCIGILNAEDIYAYPIKLIAAAIAQERHSRVLGDEELDVLAWTFHSQTCAIIGDEMCPVDAYKTGFRKAQSLNTIRKIEDVWPSEKDFLTQNVKRLELNKPELSGWNAFSDWLLSEIKQRLGQG